MPEAPRIRVLGRPPLPSPGPGSVPMEGAGLEGGLAPVGAAPTIMVLENMCYIFAFSNKIILAMLDLYWKSYPIVGLYSRYLIDLPCIHRI